MLGLQDADEEALAGLTVERFAERAWASPATPNGDPWEHLAVNALGKNVEQRRAALAARQGGPCWHCGTTRTPTGTMWHSPKPKVAQCGSCRARIGMGTGPGTRDMAASFLIGQSTTMLRQPSIGLGQMVGLLWWGELEGAAPGVRSFEYLDLADLHAKARDWQARGYIRDVPDERPARVVW